MSTGSGSGQGRIIERSVVEPGIELAEGAGVSGGCPPPLSVCVTRSWHTTPHDAHPRSRRDAA